MNRVDDLAVDMHFDKDVANILNRVSEAKKNAVAREDYPEAKKLKVLEDELKGLGIQISKLELAKKISVEQEDYDKAAQVKEDIQKLRDEINTKISDIPIFQQPLYPPPQQTPISQGTPSSQYSQYSQQQQPPPYQQSCIYILILLCLLLCFFFCFSFVILFLFRSFNSHSKIILSTTINTRFSL